MDETNVLPSNIKIEEVFDKLNKKIGYRAVVQVTENDSITSPTFINEQEAIEWTIAKNQSLKS